MLPKFRIWDSTLLTRYLNLSVQIKEQIEAHASASANNNVYDLPPSLVPTKELYDLLSCYEAMYKKLLDHDLVTTGNLTQSKFKNKIH
jgi:hypothetical protein